MTDGSNAMAIGLYLFEKLSSYCPVIPALPHVARTLLLGVPQVKWPCKHMNSTLPL